MVNKKLIDKIVNPLSSRKYMTGAGDVSVYWWYSKQEKQQLRAAAWEGNRCLKQKSTRINRFTLTANLSTPLILPWCKMVFSAWSSVFYNIITIKYIKKYDCSMNTSVVSGWITCGSGTASEVWVNGEQCQVPHIMMLIPHFSVNLFTVLSNVMWWENL